MSSVAAKLPNAQGHFEHYGGLHVPKTLMHPLKELEEEYFRAQHNPEFQRELPYPPHRICGPPTPLYFAKRLTKTSVAPAKRPLIRPGCKKISL